MGTLLISTFECAVSKSLVPDHVMSLMRKNTICVSIVELCNYVTN